VPPTQTDPLALAEGRWSLTVSATDDQGLSSTTTRRFAVNSTLGSLGVTPLRVAVRKTGGRAEIRWSQARAAHVKVTVETPEGIVVRTVSNGSLPAGPETIVWDGRRGNRKPVAGGRYVVRVAASNELGLVSLTQAITVRRVAG
jgi:flagellar hook assembly protein FlgD